MIHDPDGFKLAPICMLDYDRVNYFLSLID